MAALSDDQRRVLDQALRELLLEFGYRDGIISSSINLGVLIDQNDFPIPQTTKTLSDNATIPLFNVDFNLVPDRSFAAKIVFAVEVRDATNTQIRSGDLNANICVTSGGVYNTSQADQSTTAITAGSLTVTFSWTINGNLATFNVNANSSLIPTDLHITYTMISATHSGAITVL